MLETLIISECIAHVSGSHGMEAAMIQDSNIGESCILFG
jgi:hypothetical protein